MDYKDTIYKKVVEEGGDVYALRYIGQDIPKNTDIPKLDPVYGPPCTGLTGSYNYLIPEYKYKIPTRIVGGAVFKISSDGTETILGYWSRGDNSFIPVDFEYFVTQ
ncbi:hypothetical protein [Butyrivibrio hungatei]|uniref:Uncharacterized protein n=1 Tax=Butyrivibrio hungatei TaxID=185008 RepID=A0A1D9P338_9FIRM|nr:hypothetical protein [Butyrivibrio hungatei]AOZ96929.1 hypothetical protein bhn_I1896 [Butyrivibrio hungatei]